MNEHDEKAMHETFVLEAARGWSELRLDDFQAGWQAALEYARGEQVPVGFMFQHEDTGLVDFVDPQQVEWGFEKNNPRWQKISSVYTHPPAKPAETEAVRGLVQMLQIARQSMLDSGYNPQSSIIHACNLALKIYEEATKS